MAQTTQETGTFEKVVELLKSRFSRIHVHNTICDSTKKRQSEVSRLAGEVDTILVVGGKGSGNTRRLVKVAEAKGVKALHVETDEDIPAEMIAASDVIGVTAGASTPNWQIRGVMDRLKEISMTRRAGPLKSLRRVGDIAVMTYCVAGLAGAGDNRGLSCSSGSSGDLVAIGGDHALCLLNAPDQSHSGAIGRSTVQHTGSGRVLRAPPDCIDDLGRARISRGDNLQLHGQPLFMSLADSYAARRPSLHSAVIF